MGRPKLRNFYIGEIIDDMCIDNIIHDNKIGDILQCHCIKCNRIKDIRASCLRNHSGTTHKACGQYLKTLNPKFYNTWQSMKNRIYNKNYQHYDRYGGRGLTTDYDIFIDFFDDMYDSYIEAGNRYGFENISIDRINNNLGYVRGNLRWTTQVHQVRNSSKMKVFYAMSPDGIVYESNNQTHFAISHNLDPKNVSACLSLNDTRMTTRGWKFRFKEEKDYLFKYENVIEEYYY